MKSKVKPRQAHKRQAVPHAKFKRPWWLLVVAIVVSAAGIFFWGNNGKNESSYKSDSKPSAVSAVRTEQDHLIGRWVRTDSNGGYTLEIKSVSADGKMDAGYFNPNPINVSRAEWQKKADSLVVVVELRDVNYPGSTYTLSFSKTNDQLVGTYYQAVEGVNYDVTFARIP